MALDEPGAVEAVQRVRDAGLQFALRGVECLPDLLLGERALAVVGACDQAVETALSSWCSPSAVESSDCVISWK